MVGGTQNDRRSVRTKDAIQKAFISLIHEKGFGAIRVSDIVTRTGFNRGTFYLHYTDKYDLLEKMERSVLSDLKSVVIHAKKLNDLEVDISAAYDRIFAQIVGYMQRNAELMRALFTLEGEYSFRNRLRDLLEECFRAGLYPSEISKLRIPLKYWVIYIFSADVGVLEAWLDGGCKEPPEEIVHILSMMIQEGGYHASTDHETSI